MPGIKRSRAAAILSAFKRRKAAPKSRSASNGRRKDPRYYQKINKASASKVFKKRAAQNKRSPKGWISQKVQDNNSQLMIAYSIQSTYLPEGSADGFGYLGGADATHDGPHVLELVSNYMSRFNKIKDNWKAVRLAGYSLTFTPSWTQGMVINKSPGDDTGAPRMYFYKLKSRGDGASPDTETSFKALGCKPVFLRAGKPLTINVKGNGQTEVSAYNNVTSVYSPQTAVPFLSISMANNMKWGKLFYAVFGLPYVTDFTSTPPNDKAVKVKVECKVTNVFRGANTTEES